MDVQNNPKNSSARKILDRIPCGYSTSTVSNFDNIENKNTLYCGEDCMKKFCTSLRKHVTNVINFEKNQMLLLTKSNTNG